VAYDDARYVRLAREAFAAWRHLEAAHDVVLLVETGQVDLGPDGKLDALSIAMRDAGVPFDELDAAGVRRRLPEAAVGAEERGLFHAEGGKVLADAAMRALLAAAQAAGAQLAMPERCLGIESARDGVEVVTDRRRIGAARIVIAAGPWSGALLRTIGIAAARARGRPGDVPRRAEPRRPSGARRLVA
jgi:glycine/D-amino acid oxidase-like deaminating enzyme